jgi:putative aldouronate transport system permease protein
LYIGSGIWEEAGWNSIIYLAALSGINQELYEAARMDGAGRWKQLWHITLPCILPTVIMLLILKLGKVMSLGYEKIMLLYDPLTYEVADVISTYVYRKGLIDTDYSYSTAINLFNSAVNIILLLTANKLSKKAGQSGLF